VVGGAFSTMRPTGLNPTATGLDAACALVAPTAPPPPPPPPPPPLPLALAASLPVGWATIFTEKPLACTAAAAAEAAADSAAMVALCLLHNTQHHISRLTSYNSPCVTIWSLNQEAAGLQGGPTRGAYDEERRMRMLQSATHVAS
jgi:hypothetical protein